LLGLTGLSLLISLLLIFCTTPQQQNSWPVAVLMNVTYVAAMIGFFALLLWDIFTQRPWWMRILPTVGITSGFLYIAYFTLLKSLLSPSIQRLEPALNLLWIVAIVCLVLSDVVKSKARRRTLR
jgi:presenilin-like A22 family membrane protease